jgi:hypothetical protein
LELGILKASPVGSFRTLNLNMTALNPNGITHFNFDKE